MSGPANADTLARGALVGRRELALLDEPSVRDVAVMLAGRCRQPEPWVRAAVATLDRFSREVAGGDLASLLAAGRDDPVVAVRSLDRLARRHDGLDASQLASLAFGPTLWWTVAGVPVPWRPLSTAGAGRPLPSARTDPDVRLLLLAVIGSGATEQELSAVPVHAAGSLDASGAIVADLQAEPLAVSYAPAEGGPERLTFLSYQARQALLARLAERPGLGPDDPLLLPPAATGAASDAARAASTALIKAGNDVNVSMCRATGDFFRAWGMPGARFDDRPGAGAPEEDLT